MLFLKECKKIMFSLTFVIYMVAVVGFYLTQFRPDAEEKISPPSRGAMDYGTVAREVPEIMIPEATEKLVIEYLRGYYKAYPIGFYKEVKLSGKKRGQIAEIITELTGITEQELNNFSDFAEGGAVMQPDGNGGYVPVFQEPTIPEIEIPDDMTYEHFRELMRKADKIIGGGSDYSDDNIVDNFSRVPRTYEDAVADYNAVFEEDRITGAYARLFCDYIGIIVALLPVFLAVSLTNADRKTRIEELIYTRKITTTGLILTRFIALVTVMYIPVVILSFIATGSIAGLYPEEKIDLLAIPKMTLYWLLPNILFSTALGMVLTEITSQLIAVFTQGVMWFSSVMVSIELTGGIGRFTYVCRHNSVYDRTVFIEDLNKFIFSRVFYTVFAIVIMVITIWIYSEKRRGGINVSRKNPMRKSET